jgi:hypothetical protein
VNSSWKKHIGSALEFPSAGNAASAGLMFFGGWGEDYDILQAGRSSDKDGRVVPKHLGIIKDSTIFILCVHLFTFITRKLVR